MQGKHGADPPFTDDGQSSSEGFCDPLCDRQSQPSSMNLCRDRLRTPIKWLEDLLQVRTVNANAVVGNADPDARSAARTLVQPGGQTDPTISIAVLHCIYD